MRSFEPGSSAVVVGATGGMGAALVSALLDDPEFGTIYALARGSGPDVAAAGRFRQGHIDLTDEDSIAEAARRVDGTLRLVIVATGMLYVPGGVQPEKSYRALDAEALVASYRINAVGPALVAKHLLPLMPRQGRSVFAALSARVGSIGDNRSGGWHAYRASKAALNMIIRNLAIETSRRNAEILCVGLHPGTVATALSAPFQRGVGGGRLFSPADAALCLLTVIDDLDVTDSGSVLAWDGTTIPP